MISACEPRGRFPYGRSVAKPPNDPNQAVVEQGSSRAISANIGSFATASFLTPWSRSPAGGDQRRHLQRTPFPVTLHGH